jgi:translocation and assembly module TamB
VTWRRITVASVSLLVVALVITIGLLNWIVRTESGTRWLYERLEPRAGGVVSIQSIEGSLSSGLTAVGLRITTETFAIDIDRVRLSVTLRALLDRTLELPELAIGQLSYRQIATTPDQGGDSPTGIALNLPITVEIFAASVQSIRIETGDRVIDIDSSTFSATLDSDRLAIADLRTSASGVSIEGGLEVAFQAQLMATADFSWTTEVQGIVWSGTGNSTASLTELVFEHQLQAPIQLSADGEVDFTAAPAANIRLQWQNLSWPGQDRFRSPEGRAVVSGWIDAIDAQSTGRFVIDGIEFDADFDGELTTQQVSIRNLTVNSDYGNGTANGIVSLQPVSWDLFVATQELDPSGLIEDWPGAVSLDGRLQGTLEPDLQWSLSGAQLSGSLLDLPLSVTGGVESPAPGQWALDELDIEWGGNDAFVDGSIDDSLNLTVRLNAPRLGALTSVVDGQLSLNGSLGGSLQSPSFTGSAIGNSLQIGTASIERVEVDGTISGIQGDRIDVTFSAENLQNGRPMAKLISGSVTGTTESHELSVEVDSAIGLARAHAAGGWIEDAWIGDLDQLSFDQMQFGLWQLDEPTPISLSSESISVERGCLRQAATSLCIDAAIGGSDERLRLALASFDLSALQFLLDDWVTVAGTYDVEVGLTGPFDRPTGTLELTGASTLISVTETEAPLDIPIDRVEIEASLSEQQFAFTGRVRAAADARFDFEGTVNEIYADDPEIALQLDASWPELGFLSLLSPDVGRVSGTASLALAVDGTFSSPEVNGEARWSDGEVAVPQWGLIVDNVNLAVSTPTNRQLQYQLTGDSGEGQLTLQGTTELDPASMWPTSLSIRGQNFSAIRLPEAEINVSPNLDVVTTWPVVEVTGDVAVPFARLTASELASQSVSTSSDVIVHGREGATLQRPLDLRANLRLVLGDDVRFSGSGLEAKLTGALGMDYRSGEPSVTTGTVTVGGQFSTLGQTLELDQGRLIFSGPIADPIIDVRAVKRYEGLSGPVVVGVIVSGTVNNPATRLFSEPSMSDGDIVSYLVVGRPLSDSSRENSEALQAAAVSMGLTQALPQIQHFGEAIGLDELGVRASNANTGELMAGKQISPRMYMRYTYGLINRVGGLLLRFQLSDHLSLETRTGEYKAMDLLYMVERE